MGNTKYTINHESMPSLVCEMSLATREANELVARSTRKANRYGRVFAHFGNMVIDSMNGTAGGSAYVYDDEAEAERAFVGFVLAHVCDEEYHDMPRVDFDAVDAVANLICEELAEAYNAGVNRHAVAGNRQDQMASQIVKILTGKSS